MPTNPPNLDIAAARERRFFHELTKEQADAVWSDARERKLTYADVMLEWGQPEWCGYPEALCGMMGCWSLVGGLVTGRDYCKSCECSADYVEPKEEDRPDEH